MVGYYLVDRAIHQVVVGVPHQSFLCHLDHRNMTEATVIINWSIIMVGSCTCICIDYKHLLRLCSPYVVLKFSLQHHWRTKITKKKVSTKRIFKGLKSVQTFVLSIYVAQVLAYLQTERIVLTLCFIRAACAWKKFWEKLQVWKLIPIAIKRLWH